MRKGVRDNTDGVPVQIVREVLYGARKSTAVSSGTARHCALSTGTTFETPAKAPWKKLNI
jgi:hypothetical protein